MTSATVETTSPTPPFSIEYTWTRELLRPFMRRVWLRGQFGWLLIYRAAAACLLPVLSLWLHRPSRTILLQAVMMTLVMFGVPACTSWYRIRRTCRSMLGAALRMSFDLTGVEINDGRQALHLSWRVFSRICKYPDAWLLQTRNRAFFLAPLAELSPAARDFVDRMVTAGAGRGCCRHCGYDLRGQTGTVCPECGKAFPAEVLQVREAEAQASSTPAASGAAAPAVEVRYEMTAALAGAAVRAAWLRALPLLLVYGAASAALFLVVMGAVAQYTHCRWPWGVALAVGVLTVVATYPVMRLRHRKHERALREPGMVARFSSTGFGFTTELGAVEWPWSDLVRVRKRRACWLLHLKKYAVIALPADALTPAARALIDTRGTRAAAD